MNNTVKADFLNQTTPSYPSRPPKLDYMSNCDARERLKQDTGNAVLTDLTIAGGAALGYALKSGTAAPALTKTAPADQAAAALTEAKASTLADAPPAPPATPPATPPAESIDPGKVAEAAQTLQSSATAPAASTPTEVAPQSGYDPYQAFLRRARSGETEKTAMDLKTGNLLADIKKEPHDLKKLRGLWDDPAGANMDALIKALRVIYADNPELLEARLTEAKTLNGGVDGYRKTLAYLRSHGDSALQAALDKRHFP